MTGLGLTCSSINDKFTTSIATTSNKKLIYLVGLVTADEVNM